MLSAWDANRAYSKRSLGILRENRAVLDRAAAALVEHETLDENSLRELAADLRLPAASS